MKVILELDSYDDKYELDLIKIMKDMAAALFELRDYTRDISKGHIKLDEDELIDQLNEIIFSSKIEELS